MGREQLSELERHGWYISVPRGISMWPMIRNQKDAVEVRRLTEKPRRYDLVMYVRPNLQGVIHRVLYWKNDICVICGDNCWQREYVRPEQIRGIVTRFCRKGKWYSVTDKRYLLYVHLWTDLSFLRRPLFYLRDRAKRLLKKLRR